MNIKLEHATDEQTSSICELVNLAYRGEHGWTKETGLISGDRLTIREVKKYLSDPNSHLLVAIKNSEIVASICIEKKGRIAQIGLFAVHPKLQGTGLGNNILIQAEHYATSTLNAQKYVMLVVSQRIELINYYQRRGYKRTGKIENFPSHLDVGIPLKNDLTIEYLAKEAE